MLVRLLALAAVLTATVPALGATPCARAQPRTAFETRLVNVVEGFVGRDTVIDVRHDPTRRIGAVSISDSVFRRKTGQAVAEHREFLTAVADLTFQRVARAVGAFSAFTLDIADDRQALMTAYVGGGQPARQTFHAGGPIKGCRR